ncbi:MAG: hypothetical protein ACI8V5_002517 [Limisphaerales bacterium]|jgi:hypothetical protein
MTGKYVGAGIAIWLLTGAGDVVAQSEAFDKRPQPWARQESPALSARTTTEDWCNVVLYSPFVIHHEGKYRMWYVGTSIASRTPDMKIGYAESDDGLTWKPHSGNPILTGSDLPFAEGFQTPFVLFDPEEKIYKMWFVVVPGKDHNVQKLCYATSADGLKWEIHPEPIHDSARSPSILKTGPNSYRMWANSRAPDGSGNLFTRIYEFTSTDGLKWKQGAKPIIQPSGTIKSCVYPFVVRDGDKFFMWYGGHRDGGMFELFCATSEDGSTWKTDHKNPAFPAAPGKERFDSRYTSTPCVVKMPDRWLLYYSARDWNRKYIGADGVKRRDGSSPYSHVGVAVIRREVD